MVGDGGVGPGAGGDNGDELEAGDGAAGGEMDGEILFKYHGAGAGIESMDGNGEGGHSHAKMDKEGGGSGVPRVDGERFLRGSSPWPPPCGLRLSDLSGGAFRPKVRRRGGEAIRRGEWRLVGSVVTMLLHVSVFSPNLIVVGQKRKNRNQINVDRKRIIESN